MQNRGWLTNMPPGIRILVYLVFHLAAPTLLCANFAREESFGSWNFACEPQRALGT